MSLEKKKKELELARVKLAKDELEYKIAERLDEVERLKEHVRIQEERIKELENQQ